MVFTNLVKCPQVKNFKETISLSGVDADQRQEIIIIIIIIIIINIIITLAGVDVDRGQEMPEDAREWFLGSGSILSKITKKRK